MYNSNKSFIELIFSYIVNRSVNVASEMAGFKQEGGTEIVEKMLVTNFAFVNECKFTVSGKRDNTLEIVISHPGMEDAICTEANSVKYTGFDKKYTKSVAKYKHKHLDVEVDFNPSEKYAFRTIFYLNKPAYEKALKAHAQKKEK